MPLQDAACRCSSKAVPDHLPQCRHEKWPPTRTSILTVALSSGLAPTKSKTPEGLHRRHGVTAKVTCGLTVMWLSAWASFGVGSGVWLKQIYGARASVEAVGNVIVRRMTTE